MNKPNQTQNMKPIIDWDLGIKLANNKKDLAEEILDLLIKTLPEEFSQIKNAYENKNYTDLLKTLHKLHGAVCYCGVPRLKEAITILETALKQKEYSNITEKFERLESEIHTLLKEALAL